MRPCCSAATVLCFVGVASFFLQAVGGRWPSLPALWLRAKGGDLRCMGLRGAGGLHRKCAGDYYDDMDDDDDSEDDSGDFRTPQRSGQRHGHRPVTGAESSPRHISSITRNKLDNTEQERKDASLKHLSPAARLFLAGQNEDVVDDGDGDYEESEEEEDEEEAVQGVDALEQSDRAEEDLARAGTVEDVCSRLPEAALRNDNDIIDSNGGDDEDGLVRRLEDELAEIVLQPSRTSASIKTEAAGGTAPASDVEADQTSGREVAGASVLKSQAVDDHVAQRSPADDGLQQGLGVDSLRDDAQPNASCAPGSRVPREKSVPPVIKPSTHSLALQIQRWCKINSCAVMKLKMIKVGLPHETIQFECVAHIVGKLFHGRSSGKRAAHHQALLQVVDAMQSGELVAEKCASASLSGPGQEGTRQSDTPSQHVDDAAAFFASVAKLESIKQIEVEERVSSPGPAGSTRSRLAAAAAVRSTTPSTNAVDTGSASGAARTRQASPRLASPPALGAGRSDAPVVSESAAQNSRQSQHVRVQVLVPQAKMGLLIGTQGKTIRELLLEAKALNAHIHVPPVYTPAMSSVEDSTRESLEGTVRRKNGFVVITGPRDAVAKLKEKVVAILSGQTGGGSHDPLAYIEPYIQGQSSHNSSTPVPKEAKRLLQLIQKLSAPAGVAEGDRVPPHAETSPTSPASVQPLRGKSARSGQVDIESGIKKEETGSGATVGQQQAIQEQTIQSNRNPSETHHVDTGAFGSHFAATQPLSTLKSPGMLPFATGSTSYGYPISPVGHDNRASRKQDFTVPDLAVSAPRISALRFKLDHATQGLETVTRALDQLSMNLPENLEPYPSEIAGSFVLDNSRQTQANTWCAPLVIHSRQCLKHLVRKGMQEHPGRLEALFGANGVLMQEPLRSEVLWEEWDQEASLADILRVHEWDYVSSLKKHCQEVADGMVDSLDIDTNICGDSYHAAAVAAGAACRAVDRVVYAAPSAQRRAFVAVRPPGHHAGPRGRVIGPDGDGASSQGFCLLNSVAIAAAYARYNYRGLIERVAIVDFDAHYGDGTAAIILNLVPGTHRTSFGHGLQISMPTYKPWLDETDPDKVFFGSVHLQHEGFYPDHSLGIEGSAPGMKHIVSVPLSHGTKSVEFRRLVAKLLLPRLALFKPDLILVSAGFDGHKDDVQGNGGGLQLLDEDYTWITKELVNIADKYSQGRLISVLEGGYDVPPDAARKSRSGSVNMHPPPNGALASSVAAHVKALCAPPL